ncbi:MFS transporter [Streptomyces chattanoogensis]|uniref:MFS transporter n=1 Tax=Streptomyces chattanoogensis TaxID=66876 RepID=UPI0036AF060A
MGGTTLVERDERAEAPTTPAPAPDDIATAVPGPGRVRPAVAGLLLTLLSAALGQTLVLTALPDIAAELHGLPDASRAVIVGLLATALGLPVHGRLGDLFGRKAALLLAILVFTVGSALAGWSRSMDELTAFHALQGFGGGGLLIGVQAVIADAVPPRTRGRARSLTGAVLGLACVAGPLAGGFVTDHVSWRWCFHGQVPLGALAFLVLARALRLPRPSARPRRDIAGALLLAALATCLALLAGWGGTAYAWNSVTVLALGAGALGTALLLLVVERFAAAPLIPLRRFRDCLLNITGVIGTVAGIALFGAAGYLPALARTTNGPTDAALAMLPLLGGTVLACLVSARLIGRTGHYKIFPILGCAVAAEGMWLLTRMPDGTPRGIQGLWTGVLGLGTGLVLPVLALAVRNSAHRAARRSAPGAATGPTTTLRWLGGTIGVTLSGALLADRLTAQLAPHLPQPSQLTDPDPLTRQLVRALPAGLPDGALTEYANAVPGIFRCLVPVLVLGFLLAIFLKENPLVSYASHASQAPQAPQMPHAPYGDGTDPSVGVPRARSAANSSATAAGYAAHSAGIPVCGTVQHHDGSIVPRAALTLIDVAGRQIGRGATGDDGRYALSTPGTGSYVLIAAAGGHQPQAVTVTVGERPVELDVVLGGAGRLAGTVTTGDGTPVRDAMVTLTDVRGEVVATTRSGREGGYVIGDLVAGEYTLASSAPAFRPAALPVTVHASRETRQDIELAGGAVLRGTVRAGGGRPVEDARVTLLDAAGNVVDTATTGPDGLFRFVDLSAGEYTVIAAGYPPVATVLQVAGGGRTERDLQLGHED